MLLNSEWILLSSEVTEIAVVAARLGQFQQLVETRLMS